jgi:Tol biopolymer transport system component
LDEIWLCEADGTAAKQLPPSSQYGFTNFRVSPDGRYIVFASWETGSPHLWRMDADGGNLRQLTNSNYDAPFSYPDYASDGRWVIYAKSGPEKGIWKIPIEGGDSVRLNDADALMPAVSPNGKIIAFHDVAEGHPPRVALMPYGGGPVIKTLEIPGADTLRWTPDSREILYNTSGPPSNIWSQPIVGGKPKQVTHFTSERIDDFDLSRDGSRIVVSRGSSSADVMLIRDVSH